MTPQATHWSTGGQEGIWLVLDWVSNVSSQQALLMQSGSPMLDV